MTPKPDGFRALGVKHPKDLLTRVKKVTKLNLPIFLFNQTFTPFNVNTKCLIRQEVQLLSEKLLLLLLLLFFLIFSCQDYLSNKSPTLFQDI
jgi:hypothetical protein